MIAPADPANPLLAAALAYARRGWAVFPCHSITEAGVCSCGKPDCSDVAKHPRTKAGLHDATTAATVIRGWWQRWPDANVAIRTGDWLTVIDIDLHEHSGFKTLLDLEAELGKLPATATVITGSGGHHRYFTPPGDVTLRNSVGHVGGLGPGLDVRAERGYVIAPPSLHEIGSRYAWAPGLSPEQAGIAALPLAWVERLQAQARPKPEQREPIPLRPGNRNSSLTSLAGALRRHGADEGTIRETLSTVNGKLEAPLPEQEVTKIAGSVARYAPEPNGEKPRQFMRTDLGNAERFIARHGRNLLWSNHLDAWLLWTGTHWQRQEKREVEQLAVETVRSMYAESAELADPDERANLAQWGAKSEARARLEAMVALARSFVAITPAELDRDHWLLSVANGTLDLRSGALREHRREDRITHALAVAYAPEAACPTFLAFLRRIMADNEELVGYLARVLGYSLTGDTSEQCFFLAHGAGENGKSTLLELFARLVGGYAATAEASTFLDRNTERASNDLAMLAGARYVLISEGEAGQRLAANLVKRVTGQDTVTARFLFAEYFQFKPGFKLWLMTNHLPEIRDTGRAMWRRVKKIPFTVSIPKPEQDKHLAEKLDAELAGILAWAVRGCLDWQARGDLGEPAEVTEATEAYRAEMDPIGPFMADRCVLDPQAEVANTALFKAYAAWCETTEEKPLSQKTFSVRLGERGLKQRRGTGGVRIWQGIRLREPGEPVAESPINPSLPVTQPDLVTGDRSRERLPHPSLSSPHVETLRENLSLSVTCHSALATEKQVTPEPSAPYPGCWVDGCLGQVADVDVESGSWCTEHLERRQGLNLALLLDWPVVDLGGGEVVEGREGWQAFARAASDIELSFAADSLAELPTGGAE